MKSIYQPFAAALWVALLLGLWPVLAGAEQQRILTVQPGDAMGGSALSLVAFWLLGGVTVISALIAITRRNPVIAALFLVVTLFFTGGLYLVLHATFLAAIQVLVYAGAVMVMFMFVVMAVARGDAEELGLTRGILTKAFGVVAVGLLTERVIRVLVVRPTTLPGPLAEGFGDVRSIGRLLFSAYLMPFEALSLLLLVAIVGALMITRRIRAGEARTAEVTERIAIGSYETRVHEAQIAGNVEWAGPAESHQPKGSG